MSISILHSEIGFRIKEVRKLRKLSQSALAKSLGVSTKYISALESGERQPSKPLLLLVSCVQDIRADWLFTGQGEITHTGFEPDPVVDEIVEVLYELSPAARQQVLAYTKERLILEGAERGRRQ